MEYKQLGNTDINIPDVGLGTSLYSAGVEPLRKGFEYGSTFIDTAEDYGTEELVGEAVRPIRNRVTIATKVSAHNFSYKDVLDAADRSLKVLKTDWIDLYQLQKFISEIPLEETLGAMEDLVNAGKIRFIGVSNFTVAQLRRAQAALSKHHIVSNQEKYSLIVRDIERGLLKYCQENHITLLAQAPFARGLQNIRFRDRHNALTQVADATGRTEAQVALNWIISHQNVVAIPKSNSGERIVENCNASGWRLTPEQTALLEKGIYYRFRGRVELKLRRLARRARYGY